VSYRTIRSLLFCGGMVQFWWMNGKQGGSLFRCGLKSMRETNNLSIFFLFPPTLTSREMLLEGLSKKMSVQPNKPQLGFTQQFGDRYHDGSYWILALKLQLDRTNSLERNASSLLNAPILLLYILAFTMVHVPEILFFFWIFFGWSLAWIILGFNCLFFLIPYILSSFNNLISVYIFIYCKPHQSLWESIKKKTNRELT